MKTTLFTFLSLMAISPAFAQDHTVTTFNWVSGLISNYNGDPNTTLTLTASGSGNVTTASGTTYATPFSEFGNSLVLGSETPSTSQVASFDYTLSFSNPVSDLTLYIWGHSPYDTTTNFSIAPTSVVDASSPSSTLTWDGTTIATSSGGGGNAIVTFAGPVSSLTFTTQTAGSGDSVGFQQLHWNNVPEPGSALLATLGLVGFLARRNR